ncbi:lytic transglycosylase, catalytic [Nitrobacter winogradskyi Nb-255]|uniref:Lytic transglycosylase, catalytic n=1 Tax=Nitrobacter winogradskyi (strain ATCC 25391 / DSM 10237 / CIP 104748 / NCIMB 11846 / Nb-255) TaxID=323098 RepID=Q3SUC7_NITWN|nr:lytic transglycosylase domain-containing protein [Nitrobacter winogradskyi]ABA04114.1 lytic transglycosylase, catalytic [Nitrobacter winogradskyi Nb-255]
MTQIGTFTKTKTGFSGRLRTLALDVERPSFRSLSAVIPLIDRIADHPSDPIARQAAVARSAGQGRPQGRRSLALDRSEHGGRLMASRNGGPCTALSSIIATLIACGVIVVAAPTASADPTPTNRGSTVAPSGPWAPHIAEAAKRFAIPERWIRAVMAVESHGDRTARSPKGAIGLMQIMPKTWDELRARHALGNDPWQPRANILAGAAYLREMHDRYGTVEAMLAAYNAGPGRYDKHLATGQALPAETIDYVAKITPTIDVTASVVRSIGRPLHPSWSRAPLFVARSIAAGEDDRDAGESPSGRPSNGLPITGLSALVPPSAGLFVRRPEDDGGQR